MGTTPGERRPPLSLADPINCQYCSASRVPNQDHPAGRISVFQFREHGKRLEHLRAAIKKLVNSDSIKVAIIEDPDGNEVVFAQGQGGRRKAVA